MPRGFRMVAMRSDALEIRVEPVVYVGRKVGDVRLWLYSPKFKEYRPTKRGFRLHGDELMGLAAALERAGQTIS